MLRRVLLCLEKKTLTNKGAVCVYNWPLLSSFSSVSRLPHWRSRITFNAAFSNVTFARAAFSVATFSCAAISRVALLRAAVSRAAFSRAAFSRAAFFVAAHAALCLIFLFFLFSLITFKRYNADAMATIKMKKAMLLLPPFLLSVVISNVKVTYMVYRWEVEMENGVYNGVACG